MAPRVGPSSTLNLITTEAPRAFRYCTSCSSLNIGRYIAITMIPMIAPTPIIMSGSTIEVSEAIALESYRRPAIGVPARHSVSPTESPNLG